MSHEDDDERAKEILGDYDATRRKAVDPEQARIEEAKRRGLEEQRRLLIDEWKRVEQRKQALHASDHKDDPFLTQSIRDSEAAIQARLARVQEALKATQ
jgi:hypothetical protein